MDKAELPAHVRAAYDMQIMGARSPVVSDGVAQWRAFRAARAQAYPNGARV